MALAVITAVVLTGWLPSGVRPESRWFLGVIGLVLLVLIAADPGRIDRSTRLVRLLSRLLLGLLALSAAVSTALLVHVLVVGGELTDSATRLLLTGGAVWFSNNIVFALLYWEVDGGGSVARALRRPEYPDLAFPQHMNPDLAPPGWRPLFIDYLYLGMTNSLAFSPTDVMPLVPWAKIAMALQSLISLAILGLVVARAVNILT
ncbi:MAG TPA: hypothetical protein VHS74_13445 [Solirubrobacterales bacterium]|jgi:hypothetical protein|nr:hypothetical protein [Solirubrobacterales bacterium]